MSWWALDSIAKENMQIEAYYRTLPPVACPFDGTPLTPGPPSQAGVFFCPNGDFYYPRDWDPDTMSGM